MLSVLIRMKAFLQGYYSLSKYYLSFCFFFVAQLVIAQPAQRATEPVDAHYIYATVLGSGIYQFDTRTLTILHFNLSSNLREPENSSAGLNFLYPVALGYSANYSGEEIDKWIPDELATISVVPGLEWVYQVAASWQLKPFVQAGIGKDFSTGITTYLGITGIRSLYQLSLQGWDLSIGNSVQFAIENQPSLESDSNLVVVEAGLDARHRLPWRWYDRQLYGSFYAVWRSFDGPLNIVDVSGQEKIPRTLEFGLSSSLSEPISVLGVELERVSLGYLESRHGTRAITFGLDFPF